MKATKEIYNHKAHLGVTLERLIILLSSPEELQALHSEEPITKLDLSRSTWVKISDLVVPGVTTETMVTLHLLWFQSINRIVIEDVDPYYKLVRLHMQYK